MAQIRHRQLIILVIVFHVFLAQEFTDEGFAFTLIAPTAQTNALAGAGRAGQEEMGNWLTNPAIIADFKHLTLDLNYSALTIDRELVSLGLIYPVGNGFAIGFNWRSFSIGDLFTYDGEGNQGVQLDYTDQYYQLLLAKQFNDLFSIGMSFGQAQEKIQVNPEFKYIADLNMIGFGARLDWHRYHLGATINRLSSGIETNSQSFFNNQLHEEEIALSYGIGLMVEDIIPLPDALPSGIYADLQWIGNRDMEWSVGVDGQIHELLRLSAGIADRGWAAGLGVRFDLGKTGIRLHYSVTPEVANSGLNHVIGWRIEIR